MTTTPDSVSDTIPVPAVANISTPPVTGAPPMRRVGLALMRNALPVGFIGLIGLFVLLGAPNFLTVGNASDILRLSAPIMVVAIPMAFLLIMGHVDLSIGSAVSLAAVVAAVLIVRLGVPPVIACLVAVGTLSAVGLANGLLVTRLGLSPIIVTLGSLTALRGIGMLIAPDPVYGLGDAFSEIGYTGFLGIPYLVIGAVVVVVIGAWVLAWSPAGRHVLAIGVNEEAAFLSGVGTRKTVLAGYVATATAAGIGGVMYAMLLNSAPSGTLGVGFELDVLTAVMLGGVAFSGGRGTIRGVVLGVWFLAVLQNGLILMNVATSVGLVIKGAALVGAASLDRATMKAMFAVKGR